jgi:hypothetical protein
MHPILERATEASQAIYRTAQAEMQREKDLAYAAMMAGDSPPRGASVSSPRATPPQPAPAPRPNVTASPVPTPPAEIDARNRASFAKLSASDQAVLLRFGAAPAGVTVATPIARPQPVQSAYDVGAAAAARLLGKAMPAPSGLGEVALVRPEPEPDPRFDAAAMQRGAAEAGRLLGKTAA